MVYVYTEAELEILHEVELEYLRNDCVYNAITYVRFVSKSKGIRNGKRRLRRHYKEVHLVKYRIGFHLWHRFTFDVYATEIIGQFADAEMLKERIINLWGF